MSIINTFDEMQPMAISETISVTEAMATPYLSAISETESQVEASLIGGFALIISETTSVVSAAFGQPFAAVSETISEVEALLVNQSPQSAALNLIIDIVPAVNPIRNSQPRFKVDGVEIPVIGGVYSERENTAGAELEVRIANLANIVDMIEGSVIEFGFGRRIAGVWDESTFETLISEGILESVNRTVGWQNNRPTDSCTVRCSSGLKNSYEQTPATDFILYNSDLQAIDPDELEITFDTEGRQYFVELKAVSNLTLYKMFQEIFVVRCGFTKFVSNIVDYPIGRVNCPMGRPYSESVKGYFSQQQPVIFPVGTEIWIIDTSMLLPSGLPAPRTIGADWYKTLSWSSERSKLDGVFLHYTETKRDWDYVTIRNEVNAYDVGNDLDILDERQFREYRKLSNPTLVLFEELSKESRIVSGGVGGGTLSESREEYFYDSQGRKTQRNKVEYQRLPVYVADDVSSLLVKTLEETEIWRYSPHPYQPLSEYVSRHEFRSSGMIAKDEVNVMFGEPYYETYQQAVQRGNVTQETLSEYGQIGTRIERFEPQRNGHVKIDVWGWNHVQNIQTENYSETVVGDIATNSLSPQQNRILVLDDENATRSTGRLEDIHAGEMPLPIAVPWSRRYLKQKKMKGRKQNVSVVGFDNSLGRGLPIALTGREPGGGSLEELGNYIILGRSCPFNSEGVQMNLTCKEI